MRCVGSTSDESDDRYALAPALMSFADCLDLVIRKHPGALDASCCALRNRISVWVLIIIQN